MDARFIAVPVFYTHGNFFRAEVVDMHTRRGDAVTCTHRHRTELQASDCAEDIRRAMEASPSIQEPKLYQTEGAQGREAGGLCEAGR